MNGFFPQTRIKPVPGNRFHNLMYLLDRLALVPSPVIMAAAVGAVFAASRAWPAHGLAAFAISAGALAVEAFVLISNHRTLRSPGPFAGPFALFTVGHAGMALVPALLMRTLGLGASPALALHGLVQFGLLAAMLYASLIEPFAVRLRTETVTLDRPGNPAQKDLRIILISDLHLDRPGVREELVLGYTRDFKPDLILFPGDFTNLSFVGDPLTQEHTRSFIAELCDIAPVFVSRGTPEVDTDWWVESLVRDLPAVYLDNCCRVVEIAGHELFLAGVPYDRPEPERIAMLEQLLAGHDGRPVVLLHHSPDLIETAARLSVDLYVAGHTHGGQVRAPLLGPLYTSSRYGQRFAFGIHKVGPTTLVVSQGLGMEGAGAPRMRFLSPPEVVGIRVCMGNEAEI